MLVIKRLEHDFSICKVKDLSMTDFSNKFSFIGITDEEISVVCLTEHAPGNTTHREEGWKAFRIQGELDFSLIGILSKISTLLADNQIGIFAISTYNTDYILTKSCFYERAISILQNAGYQVLDDNLVN